MTNSQIKSQLEKSIPRNVENEPVNICCLGVEEKMGKLTVKGLSEGSAAEHMSVSPSEDEDAELDVVLDIVSDVAVDVELDIEDVVIIGDGVEKEWEEERKWLEMEEMVEERE